MLNKFLTEEYQTTKMEWNVILLLRIPQPILTKEIHTKQRRKIHKASTIFLNPQMARQLLEDKNHQQNDLKVPLGLFYFCLQELLTQGFHTGEKKSHGGF